MVWRKALEAQGAVVEKLCTALEASMMATGTTLVQIISEPTTKPLSKLTTLHNIMETTEDPPNQPLLDVYARTSAEMDAAIAAFDAALSKEMATLDKLTR